MQILLRVLKVSLWVSSVTLICLFIYCVLNRIAYPYELYWEEGLAADHVQRVLRGDDIYVQPSLGFIPFIYTPFYFWISVAFAKIFSLSFVPLRLVSVLATIGCAIIIFNWIKREGGNFSHSLIGIAVFLGFYPAALTFYDVGKPDILFAFFAIAAFFVFRFASGNSQIMLSSFLFLAAFLTKQSSLFFLVPFMIYVGVTPLNPGVNTVQSCSITRPAYAKWLFLASIIAFVSISIFILNFTTDGWFNYYVFELPKNHLFHWNRIWLFWKWNILMHFAFIFMLCVAWFFLSAREKDWNSFFFFGFFFAGMMGTSLLSAIHGGDSNVLIPAYLSMTIIFGLCLIKLDLKVAAKTAKWGRPLLYFCVLIQLAWMIYNPHKLVPKNENRAGADELMNELKKEKGKVWFAFHGHYGTMVGPGYQRE